MALSRLSAADLRDRLAARHDEEAPEQWTKMELLTRVAELEGEMALEPKGRLLTPLQAMVVEINKASRKKAQLQEYMTVKMRATLTGNETIPVLKVKAMTLAYQLAEVSPQDLLGFGKHASLTYEEAVTQDPKYAQWARTISKEEETNPRLRRWVRWMEQMPDVDMVLKLNGEKTEESKASEKRRGKTTTGAASKQEQTLEMLTKAVCELTKEVAKSREEKSESSDRARKSRTISPPK